MMKRLVATCVAGTACREIVFSMLATLLFTGFLETGKYWKPEVFDRLSVGELANDVATDWADIRRDRQPREVDSPRFVFVDFNQLPSDIESQGASVSRRDLAKLISLANDAGAAVIVVDFALYGAGNPTADEELLRAVQTSRADVVIPAFMTNASSDSCFTDASTSNPTVRQLLQQRLAPSDDKGRVWIGVDDLAPEVDGRLRRMCLLTAAIRAQDGKPVTVPSIAALAAALWKRSLTAPMLEGGTASCDFWQQILDAGNVTRLSGPVHESCPRTGKLGPKRIRFWPIHENLQLGDRYPIGAMQHLPVFSGLLKDGFPKFRRHPIVVIGSTGPLAFDTANTPFGRLHGAEIFIDEIDSIAKYQGENAYQELGFWRQLFFTDMPICVVGAGLFVVLLNLPGWVVGWVLGPKKVSAFALKSARIRLPLKAAWILGCMLITLLITAVVGLWLTGSWLVAGRMVDLSGLFYGLLVDLGSRLGKIFTLESREEPKTGANS